MASDDTSARPTRECCDGGNPLQDVRVLIVEDDPATREGLSVLLELNGAEVRSAGSVAQGWPILRNWKPDLLVSDIAMPDEDGYAMITRLRGVEAAEGTRTPAIALTAYATDADRQKALGHGFDGYASKPVRPEELTRAMIGLLRRGKA